MKMNYLELRKSDFMNFNYTITNELGIHARPAGVLVQEIKNFESKVTISLNGKTIDASSIMNIMMLQVKQGDTIIIEATGPDEANAIEYLKKFMEENF